MSYLLAMLSATCHASHAHYSTLKALRMKIHMHQVNTQGLIQRLPVMM